MNSIAKIGAVLAAFVLLVASPATAAVHAYKIGLDCTAGYNVSGVLRAETGGTGTAGIDGDWEQVQITDPNDRDWRVELWWNNVDHGTSQITGNFTLTQGLPASANKVKARVVNRVGTITCSGVIDLQYS